VCTFSVTLRDVFQNHCHKYVSSLHNKEFMSVHTPNNHMHTLISLDLYASDAASATHFLIALYKIDIMQNILSSHGR